MHKFLSPHANKCDIYHLDETVMTYTHRFLTAVASYTGVGDRKYVRDLIENDCIEYVKDKVEDAKKIAAKRIKVIYLLYAWHRQGHSVCIFFLLIIHT